MTHKNNWRDVTAAFDRYLELTGDREAHLTQSGAYWNVWKRIDGGGFVIHGLEAYGAGTMTNLLRAFCEGFEAGRQR
jgi:hypothetical protein